MKMYVGITKIRLDQNADFFLWMYLIFMFNLLLNNFFLQLTPLQIFVLEYNALSAYTHT